MTLTLSSSVPRPQTMPAAMAPANGGCVHDDSVPGATGTTSWCASSAIGCARASLPRQV